MPGVPGLVRQEESGRGGMAPARIPAVGGATGAVARAGTERAGRRWIVTGALAFAVVFFGTAPSLPRGLASWDNTVKVQVARNILRGVGPILTEPTPDDGQYVLEGRRGHHYSHYPLLASVLHFVTVGVEAVGGPLREGLPATILLGLVAWALVAWARRSGASPPAAAVGAVLTCLGTALWPFAAYGYDNLVEVLALALILWAGAGAERRRAWLWAGLAVGLAYATRLGAMFLVVPAAILLPVQAPRGLRPTLRRGTEFVLGCVPGLALTLYYNYLRFGDPFGWGARPVDLGPVANMFVPWFSTQHWEAIAGLTISPGKGLLWYGPPLIGVALLTPPLVRRQRAAFAALGAYAVVALLCLGRLTFWHGDWAWGPRYLAPLYLAVAPLAWWVWEQVEPRGSRARAAAALALFVAIAFQALPIVGRGVSTYVSGTVRPLWQSGALATPDLDRPPVPADNRLLYFRVENSPIVSLMRSLPAQFSDTQATSQTVGGLRLTMSNGWQRIARLVLCLVAPVLGLVFVRFTRRRFAHDAAVEAGTCGSRSPAS